VRHARTKRNDPVLAVLSIQALLIVRGAILRQLDMGPKFIEIFVIVKKPCLIPLGYYLIFAPSAALARRAPV